MIKYHGQVQIPMELISHSKKIKFENYKVNKPSRAQIKHKLTEYMEFTEDLKNIIGLPNANLDFVYFSCCKGAEPHVDQLPSEKFEDTTFVVPTILPTGKSIITAEDVEMEVQIGGVYEFDHTKIHSMELEDTESGCVVVMVAIKK